MRRITKLSIAGALLALAQATLDVRWLHFLVSARTPPLSEDEVADVAIVLGYALFRNGTPTEPLKARVRAGVDLFRQGRARNLLFSGSHPGGAVMRRTEANVMREYAEALISDSGESSSLALAARDRWFEEDASTSTYENALFSLDVCRQRGWTTLLIVTSPFHQLRSDLVFRRLVSGPGAPTAPGQGAQGFKVYIARTAFAAHVGYPFGPQGNRLVDLWDAMREVLALVYYAAQGRL